MLPLQNELIRKIVNNEWLTDEHIHRFKQILHNYNENRVISTLLVQIPSLIPTIPKNSKHIQILHRSDDDSDHSGHWVCSYYDGQSIYVYDSLLVGRLHNDHKIFLQKLYPYYSVNDKNVVFPKVQYQNNGFDCGPFAIAFAVALAFGLKPENIKFRADRLRPHLLQMLQTGVIELFPSSTPHFQAVNSPQHSSSVLLQDRTVKNIESKKNNAEKSNIGGCSSAINQRIYLDENDIDAGVNGNWINDKIIDAFSVILGSCSSNRFISCLMKHKPEEIQAIPSYIEHIQILHSDGGSDDSNGHWVCSHHDTKFIYIYDSRNLKKLHPDHEVFLRQLYPTYDWSKKFVKFPQVQQQNNDNDSGVLAIAFATTLLFESSPNQHTYDMQTIRPHLIKILSSRIIEPFPISLGEYCNPNFKFTMSQLQRRMKRRTNDRLKRVQRSQKLCQEYINEDDKNLMKNNNSTGSRDLKHQNYFNRLTLDEINIEMSRTEVDLHENSDDLIVVSPTRLKKDTNNNQLKWNKRKEAVNLKRRNDYAKKRKLEPENNEYPKVESVVINSSSNNEKNRKRERIFSISEESLSQKREKVDDIASKSLTSPNSQETVNNHEYKEHYIQNIANKMTDGSEEKRRIDAEQIVKWAYHEEERINYDIKKTLQKLQSKAEVTLTMFSACSQLDFDDFIANVCGPAKHLTSSEPYFVDAAYKTYSCELDSDDNPSKNNSNDYGEDLFRINHNSIILNEEGQAINIRSVLESKNKSNNVFTCSSHCKISSELLGLYKEFLEAINKCTFKNVEKTFSSLHMCTANHTDHKKGHSHACYIDPQSCQSLFIATIMLSVHYPNVRYIKKMFYKIFGLINQLSALKLALTKGDIEYLQSILVHAKEHATAYSRKSFQDINLDEDDLIQNVYPNAYKAETKRSMDRAEWVCISCEKLCFKREGRMISNLRKNLSGKNWENLLNFIDDNYETADNSEAYTDFICNYCHGYFTKNSMPPRCVLNNLSTKIVPDEISSLNEYEKILIQRAKCFQIVQRMGTVAKKKIPHNSMISKVVGRTFQLPLPLEETLKKICPSTSPINKQHELYILVRGIPTKSKTVWEKLVDVNKVFRALVWLKENNPLYSKIELPKNAEMLIDDEFQSVEYEEADLNTNNDDDDCIMCDSEKNQDCEKNKNSECNINHNNSSQCHENNIVVESALLTQKSHTDSYYEHLTIYPINEKRSKDTATNLYQMLKIHDKPLDNRTKTLDLLCFPHLYPDGINGQHENRSLKLTDFEFIRTKLLSKNSQFRLDPQYLFFLLADNNIRQLKAGIYHKLNVINASTRYTAASYLAKLANNELEGDLNTIFSRLRNTPQYWQKPRGDLECMIRHYGPSTWFLTISPAEWLWDDLGCYLRKINPSLVNYSISALVAADPISTARFADNKFQAFLAFINSDDNPIGDVEHIFWRREYQSRGTPHWHMQIWIKNAPRLGLSPNEEVAKFIMKYITCKIPDKNISPTLFRRVNTHQRHNHNDYCLRYKKNEKTAGIKRVCRFSFPRSVTDTFVLRNITVSVAGRRKLKANSRLYDLPREKGEEFINDYNPAILAMWEGNNDIQYIGDKSALLNVYITTYVLKPEKTHIQEFEIINSTKSVASNLWNYGMRMLSNRECGALEAADSLLGIPLHGTDINTTIRWLDIRMIRNRKVKSFHDIQEMDPESADIFCPSLVDVYYPNRPQELENLNLYEFARWYDVQKNLPSKNVEHYKIGASLYIKKRSRCYLINHYKNDPETQPENYFFALLLLFKPWRNEDELKSGCDTYAEAFIAVKNELSDAMQYHDDFIDFEKSLNQARQRIEEMLIANQDEESHENIEPLECVVIEAQAAMQDFEHGANKLNNDVDVDEIVQQLNDDQRRIFDHIIASMNSHETQDSVQRLFVSGEGGTGKSRLIDALRCYLKQKLSKDTIVAAPTGIAAFNIQGLTIYRAFQLPVEHDRTPVYKPLSDAALKVLRLQYDNVALIIIDEASMISNITLLYIHKRLEEIYNTSDAENGWFGKINILLCGDLLQLPPVHENAPYEPISYSLCNKLLNSVGSVNLWRDLFHYDELTINMRQKGDTEYRDILSRIRVGLVTQADTEVLNSRKISLHSSSMADRVKELCTFIESLPIDTVCLFCTRNHCDVINNEMLSHLDSAEIKLVAQDSIHWKNSVRPSKTYLQKISNKINGNDSDPNNTAGLAREIIIKIGAKIMIRRNIDVSIGLVNGTIGTIQSITRTIDNNDIRYINVLLPCGTEHHLERVSVKFEVMNGIYATRQQFPISLSYAMTIHKSQGLSLKNVVIDIGNSVFTSGQSYVALSRVTSLKGLYLINYDPQCVKASESAIIEYNRLRKEFRPDLANITITKIRGERVQDCQWITGKLIEQVQISQDKTCNKIPNIVGFETKNEHATFLNAAMQCVFQSKSIRSILSKKNMKSDSLIELFQAYAKKSDDLSTMNLRRDLNETYVSDTENDPGKFLTDLCVRFDYLKNSVEHEVHLKLHCRSCNYSYDITKKENIMYISHIPILKKKTPTLDDIFVQASGWNNSNDTCKNCGLKNNQCKSTITAASQTIIIQFTANEINSTPKSFSIKNVPQAKLKIASKQYQVSSAIFYDKYYSKEKEFMAVLRQNTKWITVVNKKMAFKPWPRNSKNIYLIFLEKM